MGITLYSTGCPRCTVLKKKLEQKNIQFEVINDVDKMLALGFKTAPLLQIDDQQPMEFSEANKWVSAQEAN